MHINWQLRELNLKVVYYGPALSGKTTNLEHIHARIDAQRRSELISLKTHEDRTLYFDFLQIELGKVCGLTPKIQLYTVPGQAYYEASRKLVLRGSDGVVFVADSAPNRMQENRAAWNNMRSHLESFNLSLEKLPLVVQFNKQDLPYAMPPHLMGKLLGVNGFPTFAAVAMRGEGVFETLKAITRQVVTHVQREIV